MTEACQHLSCTVGAGGAGTLEEARAAMRALVSAEFSRILAKHVPGLTPRMASAKAYHNVLNKLQLVSRSDPFRRFRQP